MSGPHSSKKRKTISVFTILVGLAVLWSALWGAEALMMRRALATWTETMQASGYRLEMQNMALDNFPLSVVWRIELLQGHNARGTSFKLSGLELKALPWNWNRIHIAIDQTSIEDLPAGPLGGTYSFEADEADGAFHRQREGGFVLSRLELLGADIKKGAAPFIKADALSFSYRQAGTEATSYKETDGTLDLRGRGILLENVHKLTLGNRIETANAQIRIMGAAPDFRDASAVSKWNEASGVLECDQVNLVWGPVVAEMKGTLALTPNALQPEGAFSGNVMGLKQAVQAIVKGGALDPRQKTALTSTLSVVAKPAKDSEKGEKEVPLSLQQGGLYLGPVRILEIPSLVWPDLPSQSQAQPPAGSSAEDNTASPAAPSPSSN